MGKSSRKKAKKKEKLEKAKKFYEQLQNSTSETHGGTILNDEVVKLLGEEKARIPSGAAENETIEEPSEKIIAINFQPNSLNHQEINRIEKTPAKALVHKLFETNTTTKSKAQTSGLIRDKVENAYKYEFLYKNVPPDADILEIGYADTGRIFGFWTQNTFNVISIRTNHL